MDSYLQNTNQGEDQYNLPPITNPPRQIFGGNSSGNTSPTVPDFTFGDGQMDLQDQDGGHDESNDAKRRRIARV